MPTGPVVIKKQPVYHGPEDASAIKTEKVHIKTCQPDLMPASSAVSIKSSKITILHSAALLSVSHMTGMSAVHCCDSYPGDIGNLLLVLTLCKPDF